MTRGTVIVDADGLPMEYQIVTFVP